MKNVKIKFVALVFGAVVTLAISVNLFAATASEPQHWKICSDFVDGSCVDCANKNPVDLRTLDDLICAYFSDKSEALFSSKCYDCEALSQQPKGILLKRPSNNMLKLNGYTFAEPVMTLNGGSFALTEFKNIRPIPFNSAKSASQCAFCTYPITPQTFNGEDDVHGLKINAKMNVALLAASYDASAWKISMLSSEFSEQTENKIIEIKDVSENIQSLSILGATFNISANNTSAVYLNNNESSVYISGAKFKSTSTFPISLSTIIDGSASSKIKKIGRPQISFIGKLSDYYVFDIQNMQSAKQLKGGDLCAGNLRFEPYIIYRAPNGDISHLESVSVYTPEKNSSGVYQIKMSRNKINLLKSDEVSFIALCESKNMSKFGSVVTINNNLCITLDGLSGPCPLPLASCSEPKEFWGTECVEKCASGTQRNLITGACESVCQEEQTYQDGACKCNDATKVVGPEGSCISLLPEGDCGANEEVVDGVCECKIGYGRYSDDVVDGAYLFPCVKCGPEGMFSSPDRWKCECGARAGYVRDLRGACKDESYFTDVCADDNAYVDGTNCRCNDGFVNIYECPAGVDYTACPQPYCKVIDLDAACAACLAKGKNFSCDEETGSCSEGAGIKKPGDCKCNMYAQSAGPIADFLPMIFIGLGSGALLVWRRWKRQV